LLTQNLLPDIRQYSDFLHISAGRGTSSTRARDGRAAADTRDAWFHTSVAVAAQQSKSCGLHGACSRSESTGRRSDWRSCSSALQRSGNT